MRTRSLALLFILTLLPSTAVSDTLPRLTEIVRVNSDATARVEIEASLPKDFSGPVQIPVQFGEPAALAATLDASVRPQGAGNGEHVTVQPAWDAPHHHIVVHIPSPVADGAVLHVVFTVPLSGSKGQDVAGPRRFSVINTTERAFTDFLLQVVLPAGYAFATVEGINASSGATPRVTSMDGHHAVAVQTTLREYEGSVTLSATIAHERHTAVVPLIALALSVGYLIRFRDLVTRRTP